MQIYEQNVSTMLLCLQEGIKKMMATAENRMTVFDAIVMNMFEAVYPTI